MIKAMSKGNDLITKDNYVDYLNNTKTFYKNYNYEKLFN